MADDGLTPLYRSVREAQDERRWQETLASARRPQVVETADDIKGMVYDLAPKHGVDPRLVEVVIGLESGGQPGAVSRKGAQGLMQLMPATAKRFGVTDPLDPAQNLEGGIRYLAWLRDQFPGRTDLQLAGYHAGEGAVRNAGYAIPDASDGNMTTQQYVATLQARYEAAMGGIPPTAGVTQPGGTTAGTPYQSKRDEAAMRSAALGAQVVPPVTPPSTMPDVAAVDKALALPESARYEPVERTLLEREQALGVALRSTGGGTAAPMRPFAEEGIEEAEPTRTLGFMGEAAIGGIRRFLDFMPTLQQSAQGKEPAWRRRRASDSGARACCGPQTD